MVDAEEVGSSLDSLDPVVVKLLQTRLAQAFRFALLRDVRHHDCRVTTFLGEDWVGKPTKLENTTIDLLFFELIFYVGKCNSK